MQHVSDLHSKFALGPHHVVDIHSATAEIRRGKKEDRYRNKPQDENKWPALLYQAVITRMWANAQRDGRPAEYRWRPLFNAAEFG